MEIFKLGDNILALLETVLAFWNNQIGLVFSLLGQSPVSFKGGGGELTAPVCRRGERACGAVLCDRILCGERGHQERVPSGGNAAYADPPWDSAVACGKQPDDIKGIFQQHRRNGEPPWEYHHGTGQYRGRGGRNHRKSRLCNKPCVSDPVGDPIPCHTGMRFFHHLHRIFPLPENHGGCAACGNRIFHPCRKPDGECHLRPVF